MQSACNEGGNQHAMRDVRPTRSLCRPRSLNSRDACLEERRPVVRRPRRRLAETPDRRAPCRAPCQMITFACLTPLSGYGVSDRHRMWQRTCQSMIVTVGATCRSIVIQKFHGGVRLWKSGCVRGSCSDPVRAARLLTCLSVSSSVCQSADFYSVCSVFCVLT